MRKWGTPSSTCANNGEKGTTILGLHLCILATSNSLLFPRANFVSLLLLAMEACAGENNNAKHIPLLLSFG